MSVLSPEAAQLAEWSFVVLSPAHDHEARAAALEKILYALAQQTAASRVLKEEVVRGRVFLQQLAELVASRALGERAPVLANKSGVLTLVPAVPVEECAGGTKCEQRIAGHDVTATVTSYWPGGNASKMCAPCVAKAKAIAHSMGFELQTEAIQGAGHNGGAA